MQKQVDMKEEKERAGQISKVFVEVRSRIWWHSVMAPDEGEVR
jgi:hypothetical protein